MLFWLCRLYFKKHSVKYRVLVTSQILEPSGLRACILIHSNNTTSGGEVMDNIVVITNNVEKRDCAEDRLERLSWCRGRGPMEWNGISFATEFRTNGEGRGCDAGPAVPLLESVSAQGISTEPLLLEGNHTHMLTDTCDTAESEASQQC